MQTGVDIKSIATSSGSGTTQGVNVQPGSGYSYQMMSGTIVLAKASCVTKASGSSTALTATGNTSITIAPPKQTVEFQDGGAWYRGFFLGSYGSPIFTQKQFDALPPAQLDKVARITYQLTLNPDNAPVADGRIYHRDGTVTKMFSKATPTVATPAVVANAGYTACKGPSDTTALRHTKAYCDSIAEVAKAATSCTWITADYKSHTTELSKAKCDAQQKANPDPKKKPMHCIYTDATNHLHAYGLVAADKCAHDAEVARQVVLASKHDSITCTVHEHLMTVVSDKSKCDMPVAPATTTHTTAAKIDCKYIGDDGIRRTVTLTTSVCKTVQRNTRGNQPSSASTIPVTPITHHWSKAELS